MNKNINLIPNELTVPSSIIKLTKLLYRISTVIVFILITISLGMISFFVYSSVNLKQFDSSNIKLKEQVALLETTEQQLILTKDRILKIKTVHSLDSANTNYKNYQEFKNLVTNFPDLKLGEVKIDSKGMEISISSTNTSMFVDFLKGIKEFDKYPKVSILSMSVSPKTGLLLNLAYEI